MNNNYTISTKMDEEEKELFDNLAAEYGEYQGQGSALTNNRGIIHGAVFGNTLLGYSVDIRRGEIRGISSNGHETYVITCKTWQEQVPQGFWKVEVE